MEFLQQSWHYNSIQSWFVAAGIALVVFAVLKLLQRIIARRLRSLAERTANDVDDLLVDMLRRTRWIVLLLAGVFAGAQTLVLSPRIIRTLDHVMYIAVLYQLALWGNQLVTYIIAKQLQRRSTGGESTGSLAALSVIGRILLWSLMILLALQDLGIDITALVAGLGIGGIAIALAAQNILGDLFASLSIIVDQPFVIGDVISVDTFTGTVEHIGMKTTRVRSVTGEQVVFSNADLLKSRIRNYKRMEERRVLFTLGVEYTTPQEVLRRIPELLRSVIEADESVRFDRAHFREFGPSALLFEVVYYMRTPDYLEYMNANGRINFAIRERFLSEGISIAFPTQTVHVHGPKGVS